MMAFAIAMLLLATITLMVALIVARIAASPLVRCIIGCFDSWAEASRCEQSQRR